MRCQFWGSEVYSFAFCKPTQQILVSYWAYNPWWVVVLKSHFSVQLKLKPSWTKSTETPQSPSHQLFLACSLSHTYSLLETRLSQTLIVWVSVATLGAWGALLLRFPCVPLVIIQALHREVPCPEAELAALVHVLVNTVLETPILSCVCLPHQGVHNLTYSLLTTALACWGS